MKVKTLTVIFLLAFSVHSYAQDSIKQKSFEMKTILKQEKKEYCYYGSVWGGAALINKSTTISCGGNIAWLAGRSLGIGVAFSALGDYHWWYAGGLLIEPIIKPKSKVHVSFPTVLGFGYGNEKNEADPYVDYYVPINNGFLYGETGVQLEFNPWKYMELGLGVKFHGLAGINTEEAYVIKNNLAGFSVFLAMKFVKCNPYETKTVNLSPNNIEKPVSKKSINLNGSIWTGYTTTRANNNNDLMAAVAYGANITYSLWHRLGVGVCFNGFGNKFSSSWYGIHESASLHYLQGYYGGLFIGPRLFAKYPVHLSFPITIGLGNLISHHYTAQGSMHYVYYTLYQSKEKYFFGVIEPGMEIELNLLKFMRLGVGARYRFTNDIDSGPYNSYPKTVLKTTTINVSLKFGKF